ncbi:MAG: pitrilysin family protein [Candidatus Kapabacteria bacterium]|nr:pitrilysin family protein [Candidatus Kapabacteria bacterium]
MRLLSLIRKYCLKLSAAVFIFTIANIGQLKCEFNKIVFFKDTLPNGLEIILHVDRSAPVVATVLQYKVGNRDEDPNKTGYAHFFEHLMFEATADIPRATIDKYINEAGGELNAHTGFDETVFYFRVPSNELKLALWIESERMRKLKVESVGVETQRGVVMEEKKNSYDNRPYGTFLPRMLEKFFNGGSYSWSAIGYEEHLKKAQISDFKEFYDNFYQPNNATLVVAGNFDMDSCYQYIKDYFEQYPKGTEPKRQAVKINLPDKPYREEIIDEKAQLPALFMAFPSPSLSDSLFYATQMLCSVLSDGESSRLYKKIINDEQAAVEVSAQSINLQYSGVSLIVGIPAPGVKIEKIENMISAEIDKIINEGISDQELNKIKNIQEAKFVEGKKNVLDKAMDLARFNCYYEKPELINTELENILNVTKEDIRKAAKIYLGNPNKVVLTYLPSKKQ